MGRKIFAFPCCLFAMSQKRPGEDIHEHRTSWGTDLPAANTVFIPVEEETAERVFIADALSARLETIRLSWCTHGHVGGPRILISSVIRSCVPFQATKSLTILASQLAIVRSHSAQRQVLLQPTEPHSELLHPARILLDRWRIRRARPPSLLPSGKGIRCRQLFGSACGRRCTGSAWERSCAE